MYIYIHTYISWYTEKLRDIVPFEEQSNLNISAALARREKLSESTSRVTPRPGTAWEWWMLLGKKQHQAILLLSESGIFTYCFFFSEFLNLGFGCLSFLVGTFEQLAVSDDERSNSGKDCKQAVQWYEETRTTTGITAWFLGRSASFYTTSSMAQLAKRTVHHRVHHCLVAPIGYRFHPLRGPVSSAYWSTWFSLVTRSHVYIYMYIYIHIYVYMYVCNVM